MASTDSIEDNTGFAKKNNATFPVLADSDGAVSERFGVRSAAGFAKRWTFYIDPQGRIAKIDKATNPMTAGADLAATLAELGAPRVEATTL